MNQSDLYHNAKDRNTATKTDRKMHAHTHTHAHIHIARSMFFSSLKNRCHQAIY